LKIPKRNDVRITPEEAKEMTLEEVKALIEGEIPGAFATKKKKAAPKKKKAATKKKPAAKKKATAKKKPAAKK